MVAPPYRVVFAVPLFGCFEGVERADRTRLNAGIQLRLGFFFPPLLKCLDHPGSGGY